MLKFHTKATEQAINKNQGLTLNSQSEAQFVTPDALLTAVLSTSKNYQEAFNKLNPSSTKISSRSQKLLIQQAQTLLARAHPEVVPGLVANLAILPNRFMSYFKEKLSTLSTDAGKQRFTQSIVMETLKSMGKLPQDGMYKKAPNPNLKYNPDMYNNSFYYIETPLSPEDNQSVFNPYFQSKIEQIVSNYAEKLTAIAPEDLFMQWSKNIITDIALLAPRAIGGTVGAGLGAGLGAIGGTLNGINVGATEGYRYGGIVGSAVGMAVTAPVGLIAGTLGGAGYGAVRGANIV